MPFDFSTYSFEMTIELPPISTKTLKQLIKSGGYSSATEVIAEALRILQSLSAGTNQVRIGKLSPFDAAAATRIKQRGRKLLTLERASKRSAA